MTPRGAVAPRVVVFDVDGTLYDPRPMRRAMALRLATWLALRPWRLGDVQALRRFRRLREEIADAEVVGIIEEQYRRAADASGCSRARVERIVDEWIHRRPLPILGRYRFPGIRELFDGLRRRGSHIAIWSDYRAEAKVEALGLRADLVVSAEDPDIDRMKPDPTGLERVLAHFATRPGECLMVGDRDERDGEAARRLGVPYRILQRPGPPDECGFSDFSDLSAELGFVASSRHSASGGG